MTRAVLAIASSVVADALRRRIVYVVLFFAAVMAAAIPQLPSYGAGVDASVFREVALALTYVGALVVVLALSANKVSGEIERRTVYNILAKPVSRWEYLVGTWIGVFAVMGGVVLSFAVVCVGIGFLVYEEVMWLMFQGALTIWLEAGVVAALAIVVSTRMGPVIVTVASLTFLFAAHSRSALFPDEGSLVARLYPSLDAFDIIAPVAHGAGVGLAYLGMAVVVFVAWVAVLLGIAILAFRGRDL